MWEVLGFFTTTTIEEKKGKREREKRGRLKRERKRERERKEKNTYIRNTLHGCIVVASTMKLSTAGKL
jgi:hypothetical protein